MSDEPQILAVIAVLSVLPVALVLIVAIVRRPRPRLSPGRVFLLYALLFSAMAFAARYLGLTASLAVLGIVFGLLGTVGGSRLVCGLLYGSAWVDAHPEAPLQDARSWQLAAWLGAILAITAGLVVAYPLVIGGGG